MFHRGTLLRGTRVADEVTVQLDGRMLQRVALVPVTVEAMVEAQGAADIVDEAQRRADELLAAAAVQVADVRDEAFRIGHADGYKAGLAAGRASLAEEMAVVQAAGRAAKAARDAVVAAAERDTVELVIDALHAVLGEQVRIDPELVLHSLQRATERLGAQNALRVRVHPDDTATVRAALVRRDGEAAAWEVLADGAIAVGGCIVETAAGEVDARLDVQLEAVAGALRAAIPDVH